MGNAYRDSRIVVLPDYQGLGIGTFISNFLGGISKSKGYRYFAKTIHPALGEWRNGNYNTWRPTSYNGKERSDRKYDTRWSELRRRKSYCHEYIGEAIDGYDNLLMPINHYRTKNQLTLF
jgi:GNAT superfamily N-acetyltransferase